MPCERAGRREKVEGERDRDAHRQTEVHTGRSQSDKKSLLLDLPRAGIRPVCVYIPEEGQGLRAAGVT